MVRDGFGCRLRALRPAREQLRDEHRSVPGLGCADAGEFEIAEEVPAMAPTLEPLLHGDRRRISMTATPRQVLADGHDLGRPTDPGGAIIETAVREACSSRRHRLAVPPRFLVERLESSEHGQSTLGAFLIDQPVYSGFDSRRTRGVLSPAPGGTAHDQHRPSPKEKDEVSWESAKIGAVEERMHREREPWDRGTRRSTRERRLAGACHGRVRAAVGQRQTK